MTERVRCFEGINVVRKSLQAVEVTQMIPHHRLAADGRILIHLFLPWQSLAVSAILFHPRAPLLSSPTHLSSVTRLPRSLLPGSTNRSRPATVFTRQITSLFLQSRFFFSPSAG